MSGTLRLFSRSGALNVLILFALLLIAGAYLWITPWGIGVLHDSVFYLDSAANFLRGKGLVWTSSGGALRPLTHFPPGYPLVLAAWGVFGLAPTTGARLLAALLFSLNTALIGAAVFMATKRWLPSLLAFGLAATSPALLGVHLLAMSEPLYLALHLTALLLLVEYIRKERPGLLIASAIAAGFAGLTRYIGTTTLIAGLILLLALRGGNWRARLRDLSAYLFAGTAPLLILLARNAWLGEAATNRVLTFNPINYERRRQAQDVVSQWFLPEIIPYSLRVRLTGLILLLIVGAFVWIAVAAFIRHRRSADRVYPASLLMGVAVVTYSGVYASSIVASAIFLDASTRWDDRILIPGLQSILILALIVSSSLEFRRAPFLKAIPFIGAILGIGLYAPQSMSLAEQMRSEGIGFTGRQWTQSPTVEWVQSLPPSTVIYTNEALALQFLSLVEPYHVPERINPVTGREREVYPSQLASMRQRLAEGGYLVLFHPQNLRAEMPSIEELTEGLILHRSFPDAQVFLQE